MKSTIGFADRALRMYLGVIAAAVAIAFNSLWALAGIPIFVSGITGFCPLYSLLGINTITSADAEL